MLNSFSFDVVLPCYNPPANWERMVFTYFKNLKVIYGEQFKILIIVNDGSLVALDPGFLRNNVPDLILLDYPQNQGKGYALRQGVARSTSDFCFYTDLDFPFGIQPLIASYQKLSGGADIVMGSRNSEYYKMLPIKRWAISKITNLMNRVLLRLPFNDTQAGMKGFNQKGRTLFLKTTINTFLFDTEFILLACHNKLKMETVLLIPRENIHFSVMKTSVVIRELINFVAVMLKR